MDWFLFIVGMIAGAVIFEFGKHFLAKKTGRIVVFLVIAFVLFLVFSSFLIKNDSFKDSQAVKTGASIADVFSKNAEGVRKEGVAKGSSVFNSTFKRG